MFRLKASSPLDQPPKRCPYLGMRDDPETAHGYPSTWNCCHNVKPVAVPSLNHQEHFCLMDIHTHCPVFQLKKKSPLPKELRIVGFRPAGRVIGRWMIIIVLFIIVIATSLSLSGHFNLKSFFPTPPGDVALEMTATDDSVATLQLEALDTPSLGTPTIPIEEEKTAFAPDELAVCAHALDTQIGTGRQLIMHRVVSGESLSMLARDYETSEEAIDAVNSFLPSPLWAELVIAIPVKTIDVSGFPALKPTYVEERNLSLEELAGKLSVSVDDLVTLNQVGLSCRNFSGWLLVPTEKVEP